MKYYYIAEINLPSKSAYAVHVFQMCNALAKSKKNVILLVPYVPKSLLKKIKKEFGIEYNFKIKSIFSVKKELNIFSRILFGKVCLKIIKNKKQKTFIISRSVISSLILANNNIFNYLEIHHELKSFTKFFFYLFQNTKKKFFLKYILINKYLLNYFKFKKKDFLILDDAVNLELFRPRNEKIIENTCAYFGSLTTGKGLEIIKDVSIKLKNINFHIYGDLNLLNSNLFYLRKQKNLKFFDHLKYNQIPSTMNKYNVLIMPYLKNVSVRSKNLDTGKYMSPLKLFEYLACGKIILASRLDVYSHILKNNYNSILIPTNKPKSWEKKIFEVFNDVKKYQYLKNNSLKSAKKYTWDLRVKKIFHDFHNF